MPRKKKFSDMDLNKCLSGGMSNAEIATKFKVAKSTVSERVQKLRKRNTGAIVADETRQMVADRLGTFDQLQKINDVANELMDQATNDEPELKLKCAGEIRQQLKLSADLMSQIFDIKEVARFQRIVLEVLDEVEPKLRRDFVRLLNERKELEGVVTYG